MDDERREIESGRSWERVNMIKTDSEILKELIKIKDGK